MAIPPMTGAWPFIQKLEEGLARIRRQVRRVPNEVMFGCLRFLCLTRRHGQVAGLLLEVPKLFSGGHEVLGRLKCLTPQQGLERLQPSNGLLSWTVSMVVTVHFSNLEPRRDRRYMGRGRPMFSGTMQQSHTKCQSPASYHEWAWKGWQSRIRKFGEDCSIVALDNAPSGAAKTVENRKGPSSNG